MGIKNKIMYLCTLAFPFSSVARVVDSSTEASSLCIDGPLCASGGSSSLSRLTESLPKDTCPKFILEQQVLRDQKISLTTDSPDEICSTSTVNNLNHFKDAGELESYLKQNPFFAELNKKSGSTPPDFSSCLSQRVSVPVGLGKTALALSTKALPESKKKLAVAEYYSSLRRLSDGVERSLQNITAIDLMLDSDSLLSDVPCNNLASISTDVNNQCRSVKQCPVNNNSQLRESSKDTLLALQAIEAIDKEIRRLIGPRGNSRKNRKEIEALKERKKNLQNLYPWIVGKVFKDGYKARDYANWTNEESPENRNFENQIAGLIKDQLAHTREKLKERKEDFIKASSCIKGDEDLCNQLDMAKVLAKTPPINHDEVFERDRKKELKRRYEHEENLSPEERKEYREFLTTEEKREYRNLLTKVGEADGLFELAGCLQTQRKAVKEVSRELALGALDLGIVIGTMGLGSPYVAGRLAVRLGSAVSKATQAKNLSKAKRLQSLGIFGTDVSFSSPYMQEAMEACEDTLNQLEEMQTEEQTANNNKMCESLPIRAKQTSDLKSCILQASLASLPITLPILGLSGLAVAKQLRSTPTTSPVPSGSSTKQTAEVVKLKPDSSQGLMRSTEAALKAKGYRPAFTDGLDEVNRMVELAQRLRTSKADPFTTHIPEFADSIPDRIKFIREGIPESNKESLQILDDLHKEAMDKIKEKGVTYQWWLKWNNKLTFIPAEETLASATRGNFEIADMVFDEESVVTTFPNNVFMPTTSDLGVITLNHSFSNNVFPIGVINKITSADGREFRPEGFFAHDREHAEDFLRLKHNTKKEVLKDNLYQKIQRMELSLEEREMVETIYFLGIHEDRPDIISLSAGKLTTNDGLLDRFNQANNLGDLLPSNVNPTNQAEVKKYLDESVEVFKRVIRQAQQGS